MNKMNIAEKLSLLRVKKGLSYGRLAQLAGISPSTYLQWEQGVEPTRLKLAPVLEVFSELCEMIVPEKEMRDDSLALRFDEAGRPCFVPEASTATLPSSVTIALQRDPARPETILEYEGIYSRLRVENRLTEQEAQMLLYLVKGFLAQNKKEQHSKHDDEKRRL